MNQPSTSPLEPGAHRTPWGTLRDGRQVALWTLVGRDGARARVTPWGATLVQLEVPGAHGDDPHPTMVELPSLEAYESNPAYVGAVVGRYANRIRRGRFELDGRTVQVERTGAHHLHGGTSGRFSHRLWETVPGSRDAAPPDYRPSPGIAFRLHSPPGEGGFPGRVEVTVSYRLAPGALVLGFRAVTDAPTHLSLTHHPYLTLAGAGGVADHQLAIRGDSYLPIDQDRMVTGKVASVAGTPFDLRTPRRLGECWSAGHPEVQAAGGFDHCWLLDGWTEAPANRRVLRPAASLSHSGSGRTLYVETTLPALQCFTPGAMDDVMVVGDDGVARRFPPRGAVALECQFPPDAPNQPHLPSTRLDPDEAWEHAIRYRWR